MRGITLAHLRVGANKASGSIPIGFHPGCGVDCVSEETIPRHSFAHDASHDGSRMNPDAQTDFFTCDNDDK